MVQGAKKGKKNKKHKKRKFVADEQTAAAATTTKSSDDTSRPKGKSKSKKRKLSSDKSPIVGGGNKRVKHATLSLPSRLKRERGTAATTLLPPAWGWSSDDDESGKKSVLTPRDGKIFHKCLERCYQGLSWEEPDDLPQSLHQSFRSAFDELNDAGLFLYDVIQPGGKRLSLTMVKRTLIGEPGSTYRYLGLRLFSHPWCDVGKDGNRLLSKEKRIEEAGSSLVKLGYRRDSIAGLLRVGSVNSTLIGRTNKRLQNEIAPSVANGLVGSAEYNLTLINRMEPSSAKKDLKNENIYGMGKTSVAWHKDSGLQDFSSIAVYHSLQDHDEVLDQEQERPAKITSSSKADEQQWRVAVRVASADVKTPALSIPLPSGALYYLLDDFNHQHEHAVLAGADKLRYSSTHRVAREGQGTWQYVRDQCERALSRLEMFQDDELSKITSTAKRRQLVKECRAQQKLMNEIEFDWLRQWHVQGRTHADLHPYWHGPMKRLMSAYKEFERASVKVIELLKMAAKKPVPAVNEDLFDVIIEAVEERRKLRLQWQERYHDPIFSSISEGMRPMTCPVLDRNDTDPDCEMTEDLDRLGAKLRKWRASSLSGREVNSTSASGGGGAKNSSKQGKKKRSGGGSSGGSGKSNKAGLTKKEQKRVASNWERMKSKMAAK